MCKLLLGMPNTRLIIYFVFSRSGKAQLNCFCTSCCLQGLDDDRANTAQIAEQRNLSKHKTCLVAGYADTHNMLNTS